MYFASVRFCIYVCLVEERTSEYSGMSVFIERAERGRLSLYILCIIVFLNHLVVVTWCHIFLFFMLFGHCLHDYTKTLSSHIHSDAEQLLVIKN